MASVRSSNDSVMAELQENGAKAAFEGMAGGKKKKTTKEASATTIKKTPSERVPKTFEELQATIKEKADEVVKVGLPTKILRVHNLIESADILQIHGPTDTGVGKVLKNIIDETNLAGKDEAKENEPDAKERKLDTVASTSAASKPLVPSNKTLQSIMLLLKEELLDGLSMLSTLKTWIQLNVPRIEDGDNFGVAVQEECAGEIGRVEDSGFAVLESMTKYFTQRARMVEKAVKHPDIVDYQKAVIEADFIQYANARTYLMDVRNNFMVLYDLLTKNQEKLRKPRNSSAHLSTMY